MDTINLIPDAKEIRIAASSKARNYFIYNILPHIIRNKFEFNSNYCEIHIIQPELVYEIIGILEQKNYKITKHNDFNYTIEW